MNEHVKGFLQRVIDTKKGESLAVWIQLLIGAKNGSVDVPLYEMQGRFNITRPTLYRILKEGESEGIQFRSRKKQLHVEFPFTWFAEEQSNKATPAKARKTTTPKSVQPKKADTQPLRDMLSSYSEWYERRNSIVPKIMAKDGAAMKQIRAYLLRAVKAKNPDLESDKVDAQALAAWNAILFKWDALDEFYKKQVQLTQINSNLSNIINQIRNGKSSKASNRSARFAQVNNDIANDGAEH